MRGHDRLAAFFLERFAVTSPWKKGRLVKGISLRTAKLREWWRKAGM
jgi:hypothetical protein